MHFVNAVHSLSQSDATVLRIVILLTLVVHDTFYILPFHVRFDEWVSVEDVFKSRVGVHFRFHQGRRHETPEQQRF